MKFYSIGVYGFSESEFFNALLKHDIDLFIDIRQRRGVRGKQYSFVNSTYLQQKLNDINIGYRYEKGLAPTTEIRNAQKLDDKEKNISKISRNELGSIFKEKYQNEIISHFNFDDFITEMVNSNYERIVLFCVESSPSACHRGLVMKHLENLNYGINHITK